MRHNLKSAPTALIILLGFILLSTTSARATQINSIGKVIAIRGDVIAIGPDTDTRKLTLKSPIFLHDTIKTKQGRIQLAFKDNTLMTLGRNSEMKITKYSWKPGDKDSVMETDVKEGSFRIMGGAITRIAPNNFKTNSPSGTIGIRGSMYAGIIKDTELMVVFQGGKGIYVENAMGTVDISRPGFGLKVESSEQAPGKPVKMTSEELEKFETTLASAPEDSDSQDPNSLGETALTSTEPPADDTGSADAMHVNIFSEASSVINDIVSTSLETGLNSALTPTGTEQTILFMLANLGFTGSRSTGTQSSGIWVYGGEMLNTLSNEANEKMEFIVNWDNHRIMVLEDIDHGEHDTIHGFGFGTINPDGSIINFSVFGSDIFPGEDVMALNGYETFGHFYGTAQEGVGIAMEGYDINIRNQAETEFWSDITAGVVSSKSANPYTGLPENWNGFFIGVAENMASPNTSRRVFRNTNSNTFDLTIDKTNGTIGGNMMGADFFDGTNTITIAAFGGNKTDSVYISDKLMASSLDTGVVDINGPTNNFKQYGNFMVTSDNGPLSSYTSWGHWEAAYLDPDNGNDYHIHVPGSLWIAGERTPDADVANLISTNFVGTYNGLAQGVMFDSSSQMSQLTNGTTSLTIDFASGANPSVNGVISFNEIALLVSDSATVTSAPPIFSATITNATSGSIYGTFFGPNAAAIGGNFSASDVNSDGKNYHGIFGGNR